MVSLHKVEAMSTVRVLSRMLVEQSYIKIYQHVVFVLDTLDFTSEGRVHHCLLTSTWSF